MITAIETQRQQVGLGDKISNPRTHKPMAVINQHGFSGHGYDERGTSTAMQRVLAIMDMTAPTADPSGRRRSTTTPRRTAANTVAWQRSRQGWWQRSRRQRSRQRRRQSPLSTQDSRQLPHQGPQVQHLRSSEKARRHCEEPRQDLLYPRGRGYGKQAKNSSAFRGNP
jgi:hypothetical protein